MSKSLGRAPQPMANVRMGVLTTSMRTVAKRRELRERGSRSLWRSMCWKATPSSISSYASAFLVASRELSARKAWSIDLLWGEVEKYLTETFHIFFHALAGLACGVSSVRKRRAHSE